MARGMTDLLIANGRLALEPFLRGGWQAFGWVAGETLIQISSVLASLLLAGRFKGLGPWTAADLYFLIGFILTARGISNVFSSQNVLMISRKVARGQLDHVLLQPHPLWKALAAEGFSPFDLLITLAVGIGLLGWSVTEIPAAHGILWFGALVLNIAGSATVIVAYQYMWGAVAFWAPKVGEEVNTASAAVASNLAPYPLDAAPRPVVGILVSVIPVGFIGWVPCRSLVGIDSTPMVATLIGPVMAVVFGAIALILFRIGLARYVRYGNGGRYSDFGHRR